MIDQATISRIFDRLSRVRHGVRFLPLFSCSSSLLIYDHRPMATERKSPAKNALLLCERIRADGVQLARFSFERTARQGHRGDLPPPLLLPLLLPPRRLK